MELGDRCNAIPLHDIKSDYLTARSSYTRLLTGNNIQSTDLVHRRGGFGRQHPKSVTVKHYFPVYPNT